MNLMTAAPDPSARACLSAKCRRRRLWLLSLLGVVAACKTMLPSGADTMLVPWQTYDEAYAAIQHIEPYHSTRESLRASGFDPKKNPAITILSYTDLLQRLPAVNAVSPGHLERGIADCLDAGQRCTAYAIEVRQTTNKRMGNFWLDMLNFRRETNTVGWSLSGLIFFVDDTAVYALAGGQPSINADSVTRNPLGPLQGIGSAIRPPGP